MSFDLGELVPLSVTVKDAAGALANAGSVSVTITLPDATTVTQGPVSPTSTGVYNYDYPTVQSGRHVARWVATGANAGAYVDSFDVEPADPRQIVSLADAKDQLNILASDTSQDSEILRYVRAATGAVENAVGTVVRKTVSRSFDGGKCRIVLPDRPVISITSVVESGMTLDPSAYTFDAEAGVLIRIAGGFDYPFLPGTLNISVVFQAGLTAVPANYRLAGLMILQHMWETQRPAGRTPYSAQSDEYDPRYSYSIPRRALELLGEPIGGIS